MAREESVKMVTSTGRAVIINDDLELAKKRALDDALYLASLQGGAKIDGYSSVDNKTNLRENLLVRSASEIIDFNIINEKKTKTHYNITIEAALLFKGQDIKCKENRKVNLSYLKPYFVVSSKVPAWANKLPSIISQHIFDNLSDLDDNGILDNPGSVLYEMPTRTGQKDSHNWSGGLSMQVTIPLDGGLQARCKAMADANIKLHQQTVATRRLEYEIARLKNCGELKLKGIVFHPKSPYFSVCADVMIKPKPGQVLQHKHAIPSALPVELSDAPQPIKVVPFSQKP